ncbi:TRAP transporter large permease subunit [Chloroflexota bacterium]
MEWYWLLLLIIGGLLLLMSTGMPVAFCFMLINAVGVFIFFGGGSGLRHLAVSITTSLSTFTLLPLPLFVLMGEVIYHSGLAPYMIDALDKWIGRLNGRLGLLAVGGGTVFATLTGVSMASVAMLGSTLVPEMEKRGYKKSMSLGPILGSSGLAIMIPPSNLAVLLGAIGEISIGGILIAIILPGLLMAILYATYIIVRCKLQPSIAPRYDLPAVPLGEKLVAIVHYILPVAFIIFMVIGVIFLGIATPTEAAATGALGTFLMAAAYRRLNWTMVKKALTGTVKVAGMMFLILAGAVAFSKILAFTGAGHELTEFTIGLPIAPIFTIAAIISVALLLGMIMSPVPIMMICLPIFVPVVEALGFEPVWFAVIFLLAIEMGTTSPPYGMCLFVMKGVATPDTKIGDCYRAALPFLGCDLITIILLIAFPVIALWLPGMM